MLVSADLEPFQSSHINIFASRSLNEAFLQKAKKSYLLPYFKIWYKHGTKIIWIDEYE